MNTPVPQNQTVLRCEQCHKPFDKQPTLKRHRYYCRSRTGGVKARTRACITCAKSKARCDGKLPVCSRCTSKASECDYPARSGGLKSSPRAAARQASTLSSPSEQEPSGSMTVVEEGTSVGQLVNDGFETYDLSSLNADDLTADLEQSEIALSKMLTSYPWTEYQKPSLSPAATTTAKSFFPTNYDYPEMDFINTLVSSSMASIPETPTTKVLTLLRRPTTSPGAHTVSRLILKSLKSFPCMVLEHTVPPFVHSGLLQLEDVRDNLESLHNCMSLLHMLNGRIPGSRKLFWRNARQECERILAEHLTMNKFELLASLQAVCMYMILRLHEGETEHNDFQALYLAVIVGLSRQLRVIPETEFSVRDTRENWKLWILEESLRRVCVVFKIINLLYYFEPAAMCNSNTDLVLAPLPAKKQLWEAGNELAWQAEIERGPEIRDAFALIQSGDLIRMDLSDLPCHQPTKSAHDALTSPRDVWAPADWEEWCSGMDGFGGLVMLAATLVS